VRWHAGALAAPCGLHRRRRRLPDSRRRWPADPEKEALEKAGYKPNPKPRPTGLPPPTDAEFKAWDRKDPEGEKHLYKFDKANLEEDAQLLGELDCFREKMMAEGDKAMGAEPGSPIEEQWHQFKQVFIPLVNTWQQRLLATEPRILEKSKLIGHFLEAHEMVMHNYPDAYNNNDKVAVADRTTPTGRSSRTKIIKYLKNISNEELPKEDLTDPKVKEKHDKFCAAALNPPKNTGKAKIKVVGGGGRRAPRSSTWATTRRAWRRSRPASDPPVPPARARPRSARPRTLATELSHDLMSPYCPGRTIATCPSPQARKLETTSSSRPAGQVAGRDRDPAGRALPRHPRLRRPPGDHLRHGAGGPARHHRPHPRGPALGRPQSRRGQHGRGGRGPAIRGILADPREGRRPAGGSGRPSRREIDALDDALDRIDEF
jgi:hypothetical protein